MTLRRKSIDTVELIHNHHTFSTTQTFFELPIQLEVVECRNIVPVILPSWKNNFYITFRSSLLCSRTRPIVLTHKASLLSRAFFLSKLLATLYWRRWPRPRRLKWIDGEDPIRERKIIREKDTRKSQVMVGEKWGHRNIFGTDRS